MPPLPQVPCRPCQRAGCGVMLLIFSASYQVREMPPPLVSYSQTNHAWILFLAYCWNLTATISWNNKLSRNIFSHHGIFPEFGVALLAGIIVVMLLLSFALGIRQHRDVRFFVNHDSIFLTFPGIPPLSVPIKLCHKPLNLNPWQLVPS